MGRRSPSRYAALFLIVGVGFAQWGAQPALGDPNQDNMQNAPAGERVRGRPFSSQRFRQEQPDQPRWQPPVRQLPPPPQWSNQAPVERSPSSGWQRRQFQPTPPTESSPRFQFRGRTPGGSEPCVISPTARGCAGFGNSAMPYTHPAQAAPPRSFDQPRQQWQRPTFDPRQNRATGGARTPPPYRGPLPITTTNSTMPNGQPGYANTPRSLGPLQGRVPGGTRTAPLYRGPLPTTVTNRSPPTRQFGYPQPSRGVVPVTPTPTPEGASAASSGLTMENVLSSPGDKSFVGSLNVWQRRALTRYTPEQIRELQQNGRWGDVRQRIQSLRGRDDTALPVEPGPWRRFGSGRNNASLAPPSDTTESGGAATFVQPSPTGEAKTADTLQQPPGKEDQGTQSPALGTDVRSLGGTPTDTIQSGASTSAPSGQSANTETSVPTESTQTDHPASGTASTASTPAPPNASTTSSTDTASPVPDTSPAPGPSPSAPAPRTLASTPPQQPEATPPSSAPQPQTAPPPAASQPPPAPMPQYETNPHTCDPNAQAAPNDGALAARIAALNTDAVVDSCPFTFVQNYAGDAIVTVSVYQHGQLIQTMSPQNATTAYGYQLGKGGTYPTPGGQSGGNTITTTDSRSSATTMPTTTAGLDSITTDQAPPPAPPPPKALAFGLPACPALATGPSGLPSCTNGTYVFVPTANDTVEVFKDGELQVAGMSADNAAARYGYPMGNAAAASPPPPQQQPVTQPTSPPASVYTFKETPDGNVEVYKDGQRTGTGTPQYAAQYGYTGPGAVSPPAALNNPNYTPSTPTQSPSQPTTPPVATNPSPPSSNTGSSQTFYIQSGTGAQLTADEIRNGAFPPGTYFIESGTGRQVTQADLLGTVTPKTSDTNPLSSYLPSSNASLPSMQMGGVTTPATCFPPQCVTLTSADALSAFAHVVTIFSNCAQNSCAKGVQDAAGKLAVEQVLVNSHIVPPSSSESKTYQVIANGTGLVITIAGAAAALAGSTAAAPIEFAGGIYYVTELLVRPQPVY